MFFDKTGYSFPLPKLPTVTQRILKQINLTATLPDAGYFSTSTTHRWSALTTKAIDIINDSLHTEI